MIASGLLRRAATALGLATASDLADAQLRAASAESRTRMLKGRIQELTGTSGVPMSWGQFNYELNRSLKGADKWITLGNMRNDPAIDEALRMWTLPLYGAEWKVNPASDDPRDIEIADFVSANILRTTSDQFGAEYWAQTSFTGQHLPEICEMLPSGYTMHALSTREVNGKWVFDRFQYLEPSSVDPHGWQLGKTPQDAGNLLRVDRTYTAIGDDPRFMEPLNADHIALYVWNLRGERFEGRPAIRSMYSAWFRKDFMQKLAVIWAQKTGAPSPWGSYPQGWSTQAIADFRSFVEQLRGTAPTDAFGVFPSGTDGKPAEVNFAGSDAGEVDRMGALIEHENQEIAKAGGTKSRTLGETTGGNRALGESMGRQEMLMTQAIASIICEYLNHGCGNIPGIVQRLVSWNYQGVKRNPEIVCDRIDDHEGLESLEQIYAAVEKGILPKCPELSRAVAKILRVDLPDNVYDAIEVGVNDPMEIAREKAEAMAKANGEPKEDPDEPEPEQVNAASLAESTARARASIAYLMEPTGPTPKGKRRATNKLESEYLSLAEVQHSFDDSERRVESVLRAVRDSMVADIVRRIETGKLAPRTVGSQLKSNPRGQSSFVASVNAALSVTAKTGAEHVGAELKRMRGVRAKVA